MSRALRKQMFTMIDLLEKANNALKVNLTANRMNENGIRQLLSDCQDTTITMGNELEMIYGEGTDFVHKLEEYHESLYQMTLVLKHPGKRYELLKELTGQIKQARKLLEDLIPDRLEAVFLPYKASLWDSMDPFWKASEHDAECDTYVVPIPYYDRGPDGSFTRYHYEGNDIPSHVQVTHYENYDLQKRWPDTVFIQDPYDHENPDISVDPRFYSPEIKKVADTLIYISVLHSEETLNDMEEGLAEIEALCTAPGILNADMVIVQSESKKQNYIDMLTNQYGEYTRKDWENKIFSMRSFPDKSTGQWKETPEEARSDNHEETAGIVL